METTLADLLGINKKSREKIDKVQEYVEVYEKTNYIMGVKPFNVGGKTIDNAEVTYDKPVKARNPRVLISKHY